MDVQKPTVSAQEQSPLGASLGSPFSKQTMIQPSKAARRLLWHVFSAGTVHIRQPDHHEPLEKPGAHLFWTVSGHGELQTKNGRFALAPGNQVWIVDMMEARTYVPIPSQRLLISGLRFGGIGLESWLEELGAVRQAKFLLDNLRPVRNAQKEVLALVSHRTVDWEWQVHLQITNILGWLLSARRLLTRDDVRVPLPVTRVLNAISAAPSVDWKVKDLAQIAGVSYSTLRALFTASQGETLHSYLLQVRMDHARRLLSDSRLEIKEIADRLHFSSEFYFSHFFKRFAGVSPRAFREQLKIKK